MAAAMHLATVTHLETTDELKHQPDVLTMHFEFLWPCQTQGSTIKITHLRIGATTSNVQLELLQKGKVCVLALATVINFDKPLGPSYDKPLPLNPPPPPKPDFAKVRANQPEETWASFIIGGDLLPLGGRLLSLYPHDGHVVEGIVDSWTTIAERGERMDATFMALMTDCIPAMPDTLVRNGGVYEAHRIHEIVTRSHKEKPGVTASVKSLLKDAVRSDIFDSTLTLDIDFKGRLPKQGLEWTFTRTRCRSLENGRCDVDIANYDENMKLVCLARQVILATDAKRRFGSAVPKAKH
jgi:hypothetical protein